MRILIVFEKRQEIFLYRTRKGLRKVFDSDLVFFDLNDDFAMRLVFERVINQVFDSEAKDVEIDIDIDRNIGAIDRKIARCRVDEEVFKDALQNLRERIGVF